MLRDLPYLSQAALGGRKSKDWPTRDNIIHETAIFLRLLLEILKPIPTLKTQLIDDNEYFLSATYYTVIDDSQRAASDAIGFDTFEVAVG